MPINRKKQQGSRLLLLPAFAWFLLTVFLFLVYVPAGDEPGLSIPYADKVVHAGIFGVLAALLGGGMRLYGSRFSVELVVLLCCGSWAVLSEVLQHVLTDYRSFDVLDMVADMVGTCAGLAVLYALFPERREKWH